MAYREFDHALFVQRIKRLRADTGLSQLRLGNELNCSAAAVAHWETGHRLPSVEMMIRLANFFDCTLEYVIGISDFRHENDAINYMLAKMVEAGLVTDDGFVKQSIVDRFIGYIKALEQIPIK